MTQERLTDNDNVIFTLIGLSMSNHPSSCSQFLNNLDLQLAG